MTEVTVVESSFSKTYHTDPDCHQVERADATVPKERDELPSRYEHCTFCADEFDPDGQRPERECPKCQAQVYLPTHLPQCDGGGA